MFRDFVVLSPQRLTVSFTVALPPRPFVSLPLDSYRNFLDSVPPRRPKFLEDGPHTPYIPSHRPTFTRLGQSTSGPVLTLFISPR